MTDLTSIAVTPPNSWDRRQIDVPPVKDVGYDTWLDPDFLAATGGSGALPSPPPDGKYILDYASGTLTFTEVELLDVGMCVDGVEVTRTVIVLPEP